MDHLPQNPAILVSSVNMLLRDAYSAADRSKRSGEWLRVERQTAAV